MFISADTMARIFALPIPDEEKLALYASLEADYRASQPVMATASPHDPVAERRRAYDRERKRRVPVDSGGTPVECAEAEPLDGPFPPAPPIPLNPPKPSEPNGSSVISRPKPNGFDRFWEAYPRKEAKAAARTAYAKAIKAIPGPDPPGVILAAIEAQRPRWTERQFIPHPATWLNKGRWEDEIPDERPDPPSPKLVARHDNYARSLAGLEAVVRGRAVNG